ncbi:L-fucose:H+ symporter permease [Sansalvadorimonas verongulae]|uniref:L-fucose:H+ symporter permease n=1 Tax=Sansalvadorimonas verongulae TaxID=2172824 RepID=UPI0012BC67AD|nr:L-fucose:H+ symporter permease [Sansalvadorimonas verongulae]MTI12766.1 L-fucose:H+ symporter permease [Sansalvadorimonas verongulae]
MAGSSVKLPNAAPSVISRNLIAPFILLTSCFALWGLANNMTDVLVAQFQKTFSLSYFESSLVQAAFYGAYFFLALPAALFIQKFSYKAGVLLGLGLFACGALLFYPASKTMEYYHFLTALFVLAGGLSILETSANPYVFAMGAHETATQRLNLAQAFNPLGSITGVVIGKFFILTGLHPATEVERELMEIEQLIDIQAGELLAVMGPYLTVAAVIVIVWVVIALTPMPASRMDGLRNVSWKASSQRLLSNVVYRRGVTAQFFYVGCQIGCWSFTIRYVMSQLGGSEAEASSYLLGAIVLHTFCRFLFTALMSFIEPARLLSLLACAAVVLCVVAVVIEGYPGVWAVVLISGCMSIMFPTIFGLSLGSVGEQDVSLGGSGLIMAIFGGAVLTAIMGRVADLFSVEVAYIVPLLGFAYVLYFALVSCKTQEATCGSAA